MSESAKSLLGTNPPPHPPSTTKESIFRTLYRLSGKKRSVDAFLTPMLAHRNYLPVVAAEQVIPRFDESRVQLVDLPRGTWATPLIDTLTVIKAAIGFGSAKVLEIGSYKGATAKLIAENTPESTHVWPLDVVPEHGSAYRGTPLESRIHRLVGAVSHDYLKDHGPFDLIFVDADHDYDSVWHHSACALELLSPGGVILWHDYHNKNYLHGMGGVNEGLEAVRNATGRSIVSIEGTTICIYSEFPGWETSRFLESTVGDEHNPWQNSKLPVH
jgi:hypothetical protein